MRLDLNESLSHYILDTVHSAGLVILSFELKIWLMFNMFMMINYVLHGQKFFIKHSKVQKEIALQIISRRIYLLETKVLKLWKLSIYSVVYFLSIF